MSAVWLLAACSSGEVERHRESTADVRQHLTLEGAVSVSVVLRSDLSPAELAAARADIEQQLTAPGSRVVHHFTSGPGSSLIVASEEDLQVLATHPAVARFDVNPKLEPFMADTRQITGADTTWRVGYIGMNRKVAVIDSGLDLSHADIADDLADEACFCSGVDGPCCPDGSPVQFGPGAAAEADLEGSHGTAVAGAITSYGDLSPRGVAPDTTIVAVRVLKGGTIDDVVAALDWLAYEHPDVDAVNLSIGTLERYADDCDLQPDAPAYIVNIANALHNLRDLGIVPVAAAGNGTSGNPGDKTALAAPACVSKVISVGASDKNDVPAAFSNASPGLKLWAPGSGFVPVSSEVSCDSGEEYCLEVAKIGSTYGRAEGTSIAAPHVTGAVSILKQVRPDLSIDDLEECLFAGPLLTDPLNPNVTAPRLDILAALSECGVRVCLPQTYEAENIYHSTGSAIPGGWNLHSNGYISTTHKFDDGPSAITVRARGESAGGQAPHMNVRVGGTLIGSAYVSQTSYTDLTFPFLATKGTHEIRIEFDNDYYQSGNPPQDRNLLIDSTTVECLAELPPDPPAPPSPCSNLCDNPTSFSWNGSYQGNNLGSGAVCRETTQSVFGGNCGNFAPGRQLFVNGVPMTCNNGNWSSIPAPRNGGYCVQTTAGNWDWAFVTLW